MCDQAFKTPLSHCNLNIPKAVLNRSSSEESVASASSEASTTSSNSTGHLTIVAMFDDLMRILKQARKNQVEDAFLNFVEEMRVLLTKYKEATEEIKKLQNNLDSKIQDYSEMEIRLNRARHFLDEEKKKTQRVLREKSELEQQIAQVREFLFKDSQVKFGEEVKEKLSFLHSEHRENASAMKNLSTIQEINSTGSMLSDFSVSKSEDDIDLSTAKAERGWKKHRSSEGGVPEPANKKRRSGDKIIEIGPADTVRATTTLLVNKKGPITATSIIESIPKCEDTPRHGQTLISTDDGIGSTLSVPPSQRSARKDTPQKTPRTATLRPDLRQHSLQQKTIVMPDYCTCCEKKIKFGKTALKCKECRTVCHVECRTQLPLPCVPVVNTPNHKNALGIISDYTPTTPPMVPALIIHCINEIELKGLNELGLYRIPGSEKDVKMLKEKFLRGRGAPSLNQVDIHVICGCVKDFLRSLNEPLVTYTLWHDFVQAVKASDEQDIPPLLYQCISDLPQPNRDTLAYVILHLQKIAESPECKMPTENLAKVFGPTIVGFSCDDPSPNILMNEIRQQISVMEHLIRLPSDYWSSFVNVIGQEPMGTLQQTPSTDSLFRMNDKFMLTRRVRTNKKQRLFHTPPAYKI